MLLKNNGQKSPLCWWKGCEHCSYPFNLNWIAYRHLDGIGQPTPYIKHSPATVSIGFKLKSGEVWSDWLHLSRPQIEDYWNICYISKMSIGQTEQHWSIFQSARCWTLFRCFWTFLSETKSHDLTWPIIVSIRSNTYIICFSSLDSI